MHGGAISLRRRRICDTPTRPHRQRPQSRWYKGDEGVDRGDGKVASRHSGCDSARELGPLATLARNIRLGGCSDKEFSHFREGLCPNSLIVERINIPRNQIAGVEMADTSGEEQHNESNLILRWATDDRITATDPVVVQFIPDIDGGITA